MKCEIALDLLLDEREADAAALTAAKEHAAGCVDCRDARYAVERLRGLRTESIPGPTPGAFQRAMAVATGGALRPAIAERGNRRLQPVPAWHVGSDSVSSDAPPPVGAAEAGEPMGAAEVGRSRIGRPGFWHGMGVGGSLAAAVTLAWLTLLPPQPPARNAATPEVTLALNEARDVSISVDAPSALQDAEIHVVLTGAIGLAGFDGQRELRWRTNLEAGSNQLTLPVVAFGSRGQVLVQVQHGEKRRTFVVDVRGREV